MIPIKVILTTCTAQINFDTHEPPLYAKIFPFMKTWDSTYWEITLHPAPRWSHMMQFIVKNTNNTITKTNIWLSYYEQWFALKRPNSSTQTK